MLTRIIVDNLTKAISVQELRALFEPFGRVVSIQIPDYPPCGKFPGIGFVKMTRGQDAAEAALHLQGTVLRGRRLNIQQAISGFGQALLGDQQP